MGVGGYCHALATLPSGKRPVTHCTGGRVGHSVAAFNKYNVCNICI